MSPESFTYWLQGQFELSTAQSDPCKVGLTPEQAQIIKEHLQLVFTKVTPSRERTWRPGAWLTDPMERKCALEQQPLPTYCAGNALKPDHVWVDRDDNGVSGIVRQVHKDHPAAKYAIPWEPNWPLKNDSPLTLFSVNHTC